MGNEIRIKDLNGFLRTAAEQVNVGKDKKLTTDAEISAFMAAADKLVNAGLIDENYKETLGLTITQEATAAAPVAEQYEAPVSRKEARTERKEQKDYTNDVKKFVKGAVGEAIRVDELNKRETASLDNIVDALNVKYTQPYYEQAIQDVEEVVSLIRGTEFNSKKDINDIKKEIKKDLNNFQKDIVDDLVDLAREEQIQKETKNLEEIYYSVREKHQGQPENFSAFVKEVKTEMKNAGIKGSFTDEALVRLENQARVESAQLQDNKRVAMVENKSENVKARLVKRELLDGAKKDRISKQAIRGDKAGNKLTARKLDIDRTAEDLESITKEELKKALGKDLLNKLGNSYLDLREETHNVRDLSDALVTAVGYDFWENRQELGLEEREKIRTVLLAHTGLDDLSDKEINKIMDLCHVKREPKDRNLGRALLKSLTLGILGGGAGGALGGSSVNAHARATITIQDDNVAEILKNVTTNGDTTTIINSDGSVTITTEALASLEGCGALLGTLAGAGLGVAAGTLMSLIVGMKNDEGLCFDTSTKNIKDIDEYAKYINTNQKDNPEKAELIINLARLYKEAYGDDWSEAYHDDLEKFSGNVVLNCLEFRGGRLFAAKPEKAEEVEQNQEQQQEETPVFCNVLVTDESTPEKENPVDMTKIHNRKGGDTWKGLVEAYYPDLVEKCNGEMYGKNGAIRALKKALSVNEDGSFNADIYKKLLNGGDIPKVIKLPLDINGAQRADGKVKAEKVSGNGKALIDRVGKDEIKVDKIPGTQLWKAVDGCDETVTPEYGTTAEEAVKKLKEKTGKEYTNVING